MAKWSHDVLNGLDRALHGARSNMAVVANRNRVARPTPAPAHAYELTPAIGFAALGSAEGCRFELRRRALDTGVEEQLDLEHPDAATLTWTIKVANAESPRRLDPGIQTLSGRDLRVDLARPGARQAIALGVATTDSAGNLIVFAGDRPCDGWVRAELLLRSGPRILAARIASAWFVAATEFTISPGRIDPDELAPGDLTKDREP